MHYQEALAYIHSFTDYEGRPLDGLLPTAFFLPRMAALLAALGDPQQRFPTVVVAGTKGKGSTCAMLESVLRTAGYRVGLWTSPHLHSFRERIQVDRHLIDPEVFGGIVERMRLVVATFDGAGYGGLPTTYELAFALALLHFADQRVDVAVLEVGLGGRYDSANVVTPVLSLISSISYDHMAVLGNTLAEIAYDKAGIIKPGVPVVTVPQPAEAAQMIAQVAEQVAGPLWVAEDTLLVRRGAAAAEQGKDVVHSVPLCLCDGSELLLRGPFQQENARLAAGAAQLLRTRGFDISDSAIRQGLAQAEWPGRLEVVGREPLLVLDGAHNGASAERLVEALRAEFRFDRMVLVLGTLRDKDIPAIVAALVPAADAVVLTRSAHPRSPEDLTALAQLAEAHLRGSLHTALSVTAALDLACSLAEPGDLICVTGSLSVVAEARECLGLVDIALRNTEKH